MEVGTPKFPLDSNQRYSGTSQRSHLKRPTGLSPSMALHSSRLRPFKMRSKREALSNTTSLLSYLRSFGLLCSPFGRPYSGNPNWFLFLPVLRCFNSRRTRTGNKPCTIRESRDQRMHAPTPGLSQLATPFFGARAEPSPRRVKMSNSTSGSAPTYTALIAGINPARALAAKN